MTVTRLLYPLLVVLVAVCSGSGSNQLTAEATQGPTMSLDMVTTGNTYDGETNTMTLGAIDSCLTSEVGNNAQHNHLAHLVIQNVEDLVGWQARMNYDGGRMRPSTVNFTPFLDDTTSQSVSFTNLPLDAAVHRDLVTASNIPPQATGVQSALVGAVYSGSQTFGASPDTPAKSTPDDTSYSAPSGGILAAVNLQVLAGQAALPGLSIDLDDGTPNSPGSGLVVFTGAGSLTIDMTEAQLGDGIHGEGVPCISVPAPSVPPLPPVAPPSPGGQDGGDTPSADSDGDGFSDTVEASASTNPVSRCGTSAWPPDMNNDRFVDLVGDLVGPAGAFGQSVPPAGVPGAFGAPARYDIGDPPDGYIDILSDISRMAGLFTDSCSIIDGEADANAMNPFDGYWDHFTEAHPPTHEVSQRECDSGGCFGPGDWAVDYFAPPGAGVRFYGSSDCCSGNYDVTAKVDAIQPTACLAGGQAGSTVFVDLYKGIIWKGWVAYAHVDNPQVSIGEYISNGRLLGYTLPTPPFPPPDCYRVGDSNGAHVHIEMFDRKMNPASYSCYVNYRYNTHVPLYQRLGTVGRGLQTRQPCY